MAKTKPLGYPGFERRAHPRPPQQPDWRFSQSATAEPRWPPGLMLLLATSTSLLLWGGIITSLVGLHRVLAWF